MCLRHDHGHHGMNGYIFINNNQYVQLSQTKMPLHYNQLIDLGHCIIFQI